VVEKEIMRFLHLLKIIWQSHRKWGIYWEYLGIYFLEYLGVFTPLRVGWPPTPQVYFGP